MVPTKSNTADAGCVPVSSNCVLWQGPNIPCLNLCSGDTVSDVVYKVANDLCTIKSTLDLSDLDLSSLVEFCSSVGPAPTTNTLSAVLDFIVKKVTCLSEEIGTSGPGGSDYTEPTITLPSCLQYQDGLGQTVTQLVHNQYTLRLANQFCSLKATVDTHTSQISSLGSRVTALENDPGVTLPQVTPNCILPSVQTPMATVLDELEAQFCQLRGVLGSVTDITAAAAKQCAGLGLQRAYSQAGTLNGLPGWKQNITTLADSINNLWLTICDMRVGLLGVSDAVGTVDCTAFALNFTAGANNDRTVVTLFFNGYTSFPSGFTQCAGPGSKVTIRDSANNTFVAFIDLVAAVADVDGIPFTITSGNLNTSLPYTVTVEACLTKDGQSCLKTATQTVSVPCATVTITSATLS